MQGRNHLGVVLCCLLMLVLSGCNLDFDPKSSMKTPQLPSDKESLRSVVDQYLAHLPGGGTLIRPNDNGSSSLIHVDDLNHDGTSEAVVFYETPDETIPIHGAVFENEGKTWVPITEIDGEGQVLESLGFADLMHNGTTQIVAGYSSGENQVQMGLSVYQFENKKLEKLIELLPYTHYVINDLNADGQLDLSVILLKKNEYSTLSTYQFAGRTLNQLDQLKLDSNIDDYYNVVSGKVTSKGDQGIMLDAAIGNNMGYTQLVIMNKGQLQQVLSQDTTFKDERIVSDDVNGDGVLEYGILQAPTGWESYSPDEIPSFHNYYQWDESGNPKFVWQDYMGIRIPPDLIGKITVDSKSTPKQYLKFVQIDNDQTVMEIKYFTFSQWDRMHQDWKLLERTSDRVIGYRGVGGHSNLGSSEDQ